MVIVQAPTPLYGASRKDDCATFGVVDRNGSLMRGQQRTRDHMSGRRYRLMASVHFITQEPWQAVALM